MNKKIIYMFIIVWLFGVITGVLGFFVDINIYIHNIIFAILALSTIFLSLCIDLCCQQRRKTFGRFHQAA